MNLINCMLFSLFSVLDLLTLLHSQPGQRDRGAIGNTVGDEIFFGGDSKDMPIGILRRHILRMMNRSSWLPMLYAIVAGNSQK